MPEGTCACGEPAGRRTGKCSRCYIAARRLWHRDYQRRKRGTLEPFQCRCGALCIPGDNVSVYASKFCSERCKYDEHHDVDGRAARAAEAQLGKDERVRARFTAPPTARHLTAYRRCLKQDPCAYCGAPGQALDHIQPKSSGAEDGWSNRTSACHLCNSYKGTQPLLAAMLFIPAAKEYHRLRRVLFAA